MNPPNIFLIDPPNPEDEFTSFLHYLVDSIPSIGQGIVDVICERSGLPKGTFVMAEDHPAGDVKNRPDFLLSCKEFDIRCEHKLDSALGKDQLEGYLKLPPHRTSVPTYLVLITNKSLAISEVVLDGANEYLRPKDSSRHYYFWQDFYEVISTHNARLAQDFAKYMHHLGMKPPPGEWAALFTDDEVAEAFFEKTAGMQTYFRDKGMKFSGVTPKGPGFGVRDPQDRIPYLYFSVVKDAKPSIANIEQPFLIAWLYVREAQYQMVLPYLKAIDIPTENGLIAGRPMNEVGFDKSNVCCYQFVGSLHNYTAESTVVMQEKLLEFAQIIFEQSTNMFTEAPQLRWEKNGYCTKV